MADGRHFENIFIAIFSSDFNEIWYADTDFDSKVGYLTKYQKIFKFKMADGRHIENRLLAKYRRMIVRLTRNFVG